MRPYPNPSQQDRRTGVAAPAASPEDDRKGIALVKGQKVQVFGFAGKRDDQRYDAVVENVDAKGIEVGGFEEDGQPWSCRIPKDVS